MKSEPTLGIVIAAYNAEDFIAKTLDSIHKVTHNSFLCVVVNDGSTDSTEEIVNSFIKTDSRFRLVSIDNSGPCIARNVGYDFIPRNTDYVVFTDADDVIFRDTYESFISILEQRDELVAVHGIGTFIDEHGKFDQSGEFERIGLARKKLSNGQIVSANVDDPTNFESLVLSSTVFPPGLVVHRKVILDKVGLFDPASRYAEDWDLLLRVSRHGSLGFIPKPVIFYRRHRNNVGSSRSVPIACKQVWNKTFISPHNDDTHRNTLRECFTAKNEHERRLYVQLFFSSIREKNGASMMRGLRGIAGTTIRLFMGRP